MTPRAAVDDPRFPVLRSTEGEDLRTFIEDGADPDDKPFLPDGWRWAAGEPLKLEIPRRWRVESSNMHTYYDDEPSATDLWDWVTPDEATTRYHCTVIDTWTGERSTEKHTEDPRPPECVDGADHHQWTSPIEIVGGLKENPGVHGNGGGAVIHEACRKCGAHRHTDTWATDPETSEQGLHAVSYAEADEASAAYATASRLLNAAHLKDSKAVQARIADIDMPGSTNIEDAVAAGLCRTGVERWIGRHKDVTLEQLGRILHHIQEEDRIELARGMARVLMNHAQAA